MRLRLSLAAAIVPIKAHGSKARQLQSTDEQAIQIAVRAPKKKKKKNEEEGEES